MAELQKLLALCIVYATVYIVSAQIDIRYEARWCCINDEELAKCEDLRTAITKSVDLGNTLYNELPEFLCVKANDKFACMEMITVNEVDLMQLDPGLAYTAGEYYNMLPLVAERYNIDTSPDEEGLKYYAVAATKKGSGITIHNMENKTSCHTGVGRAAGWVHPIGILIESGLMDIVECNVPVKSAADYFSGMCAPDGLARYYNPFGNNPVSICAKCVGYQDTFCNQHDPYAGYDGAFDCLAKGDGEVAFFRQHTIPEGVANSTSDGLKGSDFELICLDGTTKPYDQPQDCNWGEISAHVVMTTAVASQEEAVQYRMLMTQISNDFGVGGNYEEHFQLFDSTKYGKANVMFTDAAEALHVLPPEETYYSWVGEDFRRHLDALNTCPVSHARWCVISDMEMEKCENMIMAFSARNLKPDLNCIRGVSVRDCMEKIREGDADMITLDASDVYTAGKYYDLVPIAAEDYSGYDDATYFAVSVARKTDAHLTIFNLKDRRSCHSAVMTAAGWIIPVDKMIETGQINVDGDVYFSVGQFFTKSCVPGVLQEAYNTHFTNPVNLCEACASGGHERCVRNDDELYYGNSGAFRCLTEFGGEVAFVKHTTVRENTDGRNQAEWARNRRSDDYELLCNDGTRSDIDDYENCNMGELPSNAVCTANFKPQAMRDIYWTLLNYAQQFFASDSNPDFQMFTSSLDHKDLLFQDSTVRLIHVEEENQNYEDYLGPTFMRAMERMESIDSITSGASRKRYTIMTAMFWSLMGFTLLL